MDTEIMVRKPVILFYLKTSTVTFGDCHQIWIFFGNNLYDRFSGVKRNICVKDRTLI